MVRDWPCPNGASVSLPAGAGQDALVNQAISSLSRAYALNPDDAEVLYLLGTLHLAQHNLPEAMADFGAVYKQGGDLALKARAQLLTIYKSQIATTPSTNISFEMFLSNSQKEPPSSSPQSPVVEGPSAVHLPGYAGSAACKLCHSGIYDQWKQTGMSKMLRPYQPQNVIGDFIKDNEFYAGDDITYRYGKLQITPAPDRKPFARMVLQDGRHSFEIKQSDGKWHTYPVDYTIGSKWQQAYATTLPNGEIHVFPIQYSTIQKKWVNYWKVIDVSGSERSNPFSWEKLDNATNYKINCAVCHTSQLRNTGVGAGDSDQLVFREPGIDCEMCHGPAGKHVDAMHAGKNVHQEPDRSAGCIWPDQQPAICKYLRTMPYAVQPAHGKSTARAKLFEHRQLLSDERVSAAGRGFPQGFLQRRPLQPDYFYC